MSVRYWLRLLHFDAAPPHDPWRLSVKSPDGARPRSSVVLRDCLHLMLPRRAPRPYLIEPSCIPKVITATIEPTTVAASIVPS